MYCVCNKDIHNPFMIKKSGQVCIVFTIKMYTYHMHSTPVHTRSSIHTRKKKNKVEEVKDKKGAKKNHPKKKRVQKNRCRSN